MKKLESYMMPVTMLIGVVFYQALSKLGFLTPYLIFIMLFFTYSKMNYRQIRPNKLHFILISIQIVMSLVVYWLLKPVNEVLAQGAMICVLAPTATSAPVITSMLGGNIESLTTYSLLSNITIAVMAPICFSYIGVYQDISFLSSFLDIGKQVALLLLSPLLIAFLLKMFAPKITETIAKYSKISFYLWSLALAVVTARTVKFISIQDSANYTIEILLGIISMIICTTQFATGRGIGKKYENTIAGGQGLGQKNTILAIWMSQTYLNPLSSVAPGAYVLWQNIINSYQVWRKRRKE